jgi:hypothetical protein
MVINLTPFLNFIVLSCLLFGTFCIAQYLGYKLVVWQFKLIIEKSRKEADAQAEITAKTMIEALSVSKKYKEDNEPKTGDVDSIDITQIAKTCHAVKAAYCKAIGEPELPSWENLCTELKESNINGVASVLAIPDASPEDVHKGAIESFISNGWVYGEVEDIDKKIHPFLLPFNELPLEQRVKDYLFQGVVKSFID